MREAASFSNRGKPLRGLAVAALAMRSGPRTIGAEFPKSFVQERRSASGIYVAEVLPDGGQLPVQSLSSSEYTGPGSFHNGFGDCRVHTHLSAFQLSQRRSPRPPRSYSPRQQGQSLISQPVAEAPVADQCRC
jgi:hypothetical protein